MSRETVGPGLAMLFVVCVVVLIAASLTAPPPRPDQVEGITFGGARGPGRAGRRAANGIEPSGGWI